MGCAISRHYVSHPFAIAQQGCAMGAEAEGLEKARWMHQDVECYGVRT